jgi:hypothetical protein
MALQSYKPYSRIISIVSSLVIILASLDASQVINIFPQYAGQINTVLVLAGLIAPAISQELRVTRAEDIVKDDLNNNEDAIQVHLNINGEDILEVVNEDTMNDECTEDSIDESDVA